MRAWAVLLVLILLIGAGWLAMYPNTSDPKNIRYILWKIGFPALDIDKAVGTMVGDAHGDRLVLGKTKEYLRSRFGYLLGPNEANPYLRAFYLNSAWKDRDVLFIRMSQWMVVFDDGVATRLVLVKGS
jgi:hypothetical protein